MRGRDVLHHVSKTAAHGIMELSSTRRLPKDILLQIAERVKKSTLKKKKPINRESAGRTKAPKSQSTSVARGLSNVVLLNDEQPVSSSLPTAKRFLAQQQFGKRQKRVPLLTYQAQKYHREPAKNFKRASKD